MSVETYEKAALHLLSVLIQLTGCTRQEIDERLGFSRGYTSRLLTGNCKLLYRHVLLILEATEITPEFFFQVLHGSVRPTASVRRPGAEAPDLEARIREAARRVASELGMPERAPGSKPRKKSVAVSAGSS